MESEKDMPDVRREFKAILEAIVVVVVSWRRRLGRNASPDKFPRDSHTIHLLLHRPVLLDITKRKIIARGCPI
jgi:hypothetical protein